MFPKRESDCMYITCAGSNDSWQGHRLRRGDGRTSSEQVRQSDHSEQKTEELYFFCLKRRMICVCDQVVFRKDNPYLSSCEALDSEDFGDEVVVFYPSFELKSPT